MSPRALLAVAGLAVVSTGFGAAAQAPAHRHDGADGCGKARAAERWLAAGRRPVEDPEGYCTMCDVVEMTDVLHCNLDIEVVPASSTITGSNTFTIRSQVDGLTTFTFRLRSNFTITSALINGSTPVTVANPTTTTRVATLDRAYNTGEIFTLRIGYSGVPVSVGGFGSVEFTTQNGQPLFQTLSEPYYGYTWWPCKDGDVAAAGDNSDKFTCEVAVTAPSTMKSVAAGTLQGVDALSGGRSKYRWASNYPIATYLVFVGSTNYNQWTVPYNHPGGTMPVEFSIYPASDNAGNRAAWARVVDMLPVCRSVFGEYPFISEKYGIYHFNFGGGMEHQTYTGQGTFSESVTAHELGHQWWGDDVTCRTWSDIWLNEGFATYTEALWEERKPGSSGLPALFAAMAARRPGTISGTVYRTDVSSANTIFSGTYAYRKGGWVLHQLRHIVGDATFFNILAAYRAAYSGSAATTDDFAAVASAVYGQDLSWVFQQCVYGPGAPAYAYGWEPVTINGQHYIRLRLRQTQTAYPVFTFPVDVRVNSASGSQTRAVWNDAATEWFVIPVSAPATGVAIDEFDWILNTGKATEGYVPGPPAVVQAAPSPGQTFPAAGAPSTIRVTFSEAVNASAANFELTGPGGPVACSFAYSAANFTATLTPAAPLGPGQYTVRVRDTLISAAAGAALDGEIAAGVLPSGNGQPAGDAVYTFTIEAAACYANCDGSTIIPTLNVNDFICFQTRFAANDPYANCDGSTIAPVLNVNDFICFQTAFAQGCP